MIGNLDAILKLMGIGAGVAVLLVSLAAMGRAATKKPGTTNQVWPGGSFKPDDHQPNTRTTP